MKSKTSASLFALLLAAAYFPAAGQESGTVSLLLQVNQGDSGYMPYVIGLEKGFFKEQGVELRVLNLPGKPGAAKADMEIMGRTQFYVELAKTPARYRMFAAGVQDRTSYNDAIVVRSDLKGASLKEIGPIKAFPYLGGGPACGPVIRMILAEAGLSSEKTAIARLKLDAFRAAKPAAAYLREPFLGMFLKEGGYRIIIDGPIFASRVLSPWPMVIAAFSGEFLKARPETARKTVAAYDKALAFIRDNPAAAEEIFAVYVEKATGVKGLRTRPIKNLRSDEVETGLIQKQGDWYFQHKLSSARIDAKTVFYGGRAAR